MVSNEDASSIEGLVHGLSFCEKYVKLCGYTTGYGKNTDENGVVSLDALVVDGTLRKSGAVGNLRNIKNATGVAYHVLRNTKHSLLSGMEATVFAMSMGFPLEILDTFKSLEAYKLWVTYGCRPHFWQNLPHKKNLCNPFSTKEAQHRHRGMNQYYYPDRGYSRNFFRNNFHKQSYFKKSRKHRKKSSPRESIAADYNYDGVSMIVVDGDGNIAAGSSSSGPNHKISGRVGSSALVGASAYADSKFGAAIAVGNSDLLQHFSPSTLAVDRLRSGANSFGAAHYVLRTMVASFPGFVGGIVVINNGGEYSASCSGKSKFTFTAMNLILKKATTFKMNCLQPRAKLYYN